MNVLRSLSRSTGSASRTFWTVDLFILSYLGRVQSRTTVVRADEIERIASGFSGEPLTYRNSIKFEDRYNCFGDPITGTDAV